MTTLYNWHRDDAGQPGTSEPVAVYVPTYNERGALESETLHVRATKSPDASGRAELHAARRRGEERRGDQAHHLGRQGPEAQPRARQRHDDALHLRPETFRLVHLYTRRDARFTGRLRRRSRRRAARRARAACRTCTTPTTRSATSPTSRTTRRTRSGSPTSRSSRATTTSTTRSTA